MISPDLPISKFVDDVLNWNSFAKGLMRTMSEDYRR